MKGNLLAGLPVKIDFFSIYPWKLKDIINADLDYYQHLLIFFIKKEDLGFGGELAKQAESYSVFDLIRVRAIWGDTFQAQVLKSLKLFTKEDFLFEDGVFALNGNILTEEHWLQIQTTLATENHLDIKAMMGEEEEDYDFANDAAREFRERAKRTREMVDKYKKKKDASLEFLINRFCAKSPNLNILDIWDCTFYQFKQQFDAVISVEKYDINMTALLSGRLDTKQQKKISHWTENN